MHASLSFSLSFFLSFSNTFIYTVLAQLQEDIRQANRGLEYNKYQLQAQSGGKKAKLDRAIELQAYRYISRKETTSQMHHRGVYSRERRERQRETERDVRNERNSEGSWDR